MASTDRGDPPENPLETEFLEALLNPARLSGFYHMLLESQVWVVGRLVPPGQGLGDGTVVAGDRTAVEAPTITTEGEEGQDVVPIFTSRSRVERAIRRGPPPGMGPLSLTARHAFEAFPGRGFVINPWSSFGKILTPLEVSALLAGREGAAAAMGGSLAPRSEFVPLPADAAGRLRAPTTLPKDLLDALRDRMRKSGIVKRAYIAEISEPEDGTVHPIVALELTFGAQGKFVDLCYDLKEVVSKLVPPNRYIDFVKLRHGSFDRRIRESEPFFRR